MKIGPGEGYAAIPSNGLYVNSSLISSPARNWRRHERHGPYPCATSACAGQPYCGERLVARAALAISWLTPSMRHVMMLARRYGDQFRSGRKMITPAPRVDPILAQRKVARI